MKNPHEKKSRDKSRDRAGVKAQRRKARAAKAARRAFEAKGVGKRWR